MKLPGNVWLKRKPMLRKRLRRTKLDVKRNSQLLMKPTEPNTKLKKLLVKRLSRRNSCV